jgi:hypothetical protein
MPGRNMQLKAGPIIVEKRIVQKASGKAAVTIRKISHTRNMARLV